MKTFLAILLCTSIGYAQKKSSFGSISLSEDTTHVQGVNQVWKDSLGRMYFEVMLAPQSSGAYVLNPNLVLVPFPGEIFTPERFDFLMTKINLWKAEFLVKQAEEREKK